ncbi:MAG: site-2 protease family protein [Thermodesulfobacteriota bacterium]
MHTTTPAQDSAAPTQATPRFRPDIVAHTFEEKGDARSIVLEDPVANKFFRVSSYEYEFLRALDGHLTIAQAIDRLRLNGRFFAADHAIKLVNQSSRSGLLLGTPYGTSATQLALRKTIRKTASYRTVSRLYFLYLPLLNPDRFLDRTLWIWHLLVNRFTGTVFGLALPLAVYLAIADLPRLHSEFLFFFNLSNLMVLWMAIALVKLAHEFSHAYTAKSFGLRVPEMGVAFLLFFPCLYCNTTAAWQLASPRERIAISAAGIMAEAAVATAAVFVWYFTQPGLLNSVAFWLMAISVVSSLFFNGNPLMRYDGYFMLVDMLRIPNLQTRAFARIRYLFLNRVWGIESATDRAESPRDHAILVVYGVLAMVYRVFLYSGIVAAVYFKFDKSIGFALGLVAFALFIVLPVAKGASGLVKRGSEMRPRLRGVIVFLVLVTAVLWLLTRPWSDKSVYPCYLDSALERQIVIPVQAPVREVLVRERDAVKPGQLVLKLDSRHLEFVLKDKEAERLLTEREIKIIEDTGKNLESLPLKRIALMKTQDAVDKVRDDLANLEWRAPFEGHITRLAASLQQGARYGKGAVVGELASGTSCEVVALVPEADVAQISRGQEVETWFPVAEGKSYRLRLREMSPFSREDLAGSPFSSRLGGEIATEPKGREKKESPLDAYYACRMDFSNRDGIPLGITGRMVVRHAPRSILERLIQSLYQTFNREMVL